MAYAEYPKAMVHPNYVPAVVDLTAPKAAVFPPVTVMNEEQEEYHRSLGYTSTGGDPSAHQPDLPPGYEPKEYPKWVGEVLVNSAEEEAALIPVPDPEDEPESQVIEPEAQGIEDADVELDKDALAEEGSEHVA